MPKDSNLEKHVLEGDSVEQKAMKKEEEKEMSFEEWDDWFIEGERRRYEEWLEQPTPFSIKVHNWIVTMEEKIKFFIDRYRLRRLIANYRWRHGGRERYDGYMRGVHECYEREWRKEEAIVEEEFGIRIIYKG